MTRLKLTLIALLTAALVVTSLPLQAFAQSQTDFKPFLTTTRMYAKNGNSDEYVIKAPYEIFTRDDINFPQKAEWKASFDKALKEGDWVVTQYTTTTGTSAMVNLYWTETASTKAKLHYDNGRYMFNVWPETWKRIDLHTFENGKPYVIRHTSSFSTISLSRPADSGFSVRTILATPSYTKDKSAENYDIMIPKTIDDPRQPEFAWNVNEKGELFVTYMKNDQKLNSYLNYCKARWFINEVTADYKSVVREGVFNDLVPIPIHSYQFDNRGFYNLKITIECNIHPPLLPYDHSYIRPLTFNIPFDGNYHRGSTFKHCDSDNNCNPEPIDCNQLTGVSRVACTVNTQFNFGVLNPSLFAMRSLVSSFFVPTVPTCGIGFSVVGNKVVDSFSPSKAVAEACRLSARFQQKFPLLIVITNFVVASAVLWLIIRAVNNLLDHRKDEVVGGM